MLDANDWKIIREEGDDIRRDLKNQTEHLKDTNQLLRDIVSELIKLNSKIKY